MSKYRVPDDTEFVMTDNLDIDLNRYNNLTANVTVRASDLTPYAVLDVTTEAGEGAGVYLNREGILDLINALARIANDLD